MKLIEVTKAFATEEQCLAYLEAKRWPNGVRCLTCGSKDISRITRKVTKKSDNKRAQLYQCLEPSCKAQFSATTGTIFNGSHLPLDKWYMAIALIVDAKKGMSALQLQRHLKVNYRTAWYLSHRIREAMVDTDAPKLKGIVEIDETYIGGKQRGNPGKLKNKDVVIGVRERGGQLRLEQVPDNKEDTVYQVIADNVSKDAEAIMTDESTIYNFRNTQFHRVGKQKLRKISVFPFWEMALDWIVVSPQASPVRERQSAHGSFLPLVRRRAKEHRLRCRSAGSVCPCESSGCSQLS
jgi:hypothetical protein